MIVVCNISPKSRLDTHSLALLNISTKNPIDSLTLSIVICNCSLKFKLDTHSLALLKRLIISFIDPLTLSIVICNCSLKFKLDTHSLALLKRLIISFIDPLTLSIVICNCSLKFKESIHILISSNISTKNPIETFTASMIGSIVLFNQEVIDVILFVIFSIIPAENSLNFSQDSSSPTHPKIFVTSLSNPSQTIFPESRISPKESSINFSKPSNIVEGSSSIFISSKILSNLSENIFLKSSAFINPKVKTSKIFPIKTDIESEISPDF